MTRTLSVSRPTLYLLLSLATASAALAMVAPARAELPPLIDREIFFGDPEISGAQISPDCRFISFIQPLDGTRNVWVKRAEQPYDAARPVTADTRRPIPAYFWSRDSKYILYVQDQAGDENFNVYAVDPAAPAAEDSKVPPARDLTGAKGARAYIYQVSERDPDLMFVGLNDRDRPPRTPWSAAPANIEACALRRNVPAGAAK